MATLYLDLTNGNNSNDCTSFANRGLTITGGITAARTAPGDFIRLMKSETPVSIGNAAWTNKSPTLTLAGALTKNIYLDGAWTAPANVTCTTSTTRKEGSTSSSIAFAGAFGTGKGAHYDMGSSQDFSAYDSICLFMRSSGTHAAGVFQILLCSDATGDVTVETFTVNEPLNSNQWRAIVLPKGSALGSSLRSITLSCVSDPGTVTVLIDNVMGCNANSIDLATVLTKSSSETNLEYYTIQSINGATVKFDGNSNSQQTTTFRGYYGTTETVTTYKVKPIRITAAQAIQEAGTAAARSTYSGGWDMTNMSTQTGVTIIDAADENISAITSSVGHIIFEKIVTVRGTRGFNISGGSNFSFLNCGAHATASSSGAFNGVQGSYFYNCHSYHSANTGFNCPAAHQVTFDSCVSSGHSSNGFAGSSSAGLSYLNCTSHNNGGQGFDITGSAFMFKPVFRDNLNFGISVVNGVITLIAPTSSANSGSALSAANGGVINVDDTSGCSDSTIYGGSSGYINVSRLNGTVSDRRVRFNSAWVIQTDAATVHSPATLSYKHTPQSGYHREECPLVQKCKPFAVSDTGTLTVSVWVRRDHATNVGAKLVVRGMQVDGISTDLVDTISVGADTWEELTVSGDPEENVPIVVELHSYFVNVATSTNNVYFGDFTVTQS